VITIRLSKDLAEWLARVAAKMGVAQGVEAIVKGIADTIPTLPTFA